MTRWIALIAAGVAALVGFAATAIHFIRRHKKVSY